MYNDFAHAPSKLKATTEGLAELHPKRKLVACYELHTFSSLKKEFLAQYKGTYNAPKEALIFIDEKVLEEKKYESISEEEVRTAFKRKDIRVFSNQNALEAHLLAQSWADKDLIFMSSGNFGGLDLDNLSHQITQ